MKNTPIIIDWNYWDARMASLALARQKPSRQLSGFLVYWEQLYLFGYGGQTP